MDMDIKKRLAEAEKGDPLAQYEVGVMYQEGLGVPQDLIEAMEWFVRSAEQDDFAQYCVHILMYDVGKDGFQDHEEMAKWFRQAAEAGLGETVTGPVDPGKIEEKWLKLGAEHGNVHAQRNLGFFYQEGVGGQPNYEESLKWMRIAAVNGDAIAQRNLGYIYEKGLGVPPNPDESAKWYDLAADQGAK